MDYLDVGRRLDIRSFRCFSSEIMNQWVKVIDALILKSFVKQLEVDGKARTQFDLFIFIHNRNKFLIKQTENYTKISFCNSAPNEFFEEIENDPNCDLLEYPVAIEFNNNDLSKVKFHTVALNEFINALVQRDVIPRNQAITFLKELKNKSNEEAKHISSELQLTLYFRHLFDVYTSGMGLTDSRSNHHFVEEDIFMKKFSIDGCEGVILQIHSYMELYMLNDFQQLMVIPSNLLDTSLTYKNSDNFVVSELLELKTTPFMSLIKPAGYFSSLVNYKKFPYNLEAVNCDVFKVHQLLLSRTHNAILKSHKK